MRSLTWAKNGVAWLFKRQAKGGSLFDGLLKQFEATFGNVLVFWGEEKNNETSGSKSLVGWLVVWLCCVGWLFGWLVGCVGWFGWLFFKENSAKVEIMG